MKSNLPKLNRTLYFIVLALLGVFYMLANFPKEFSRLWGLVILVVALVALIFSALEKRAILMAFFGVFVVAQLPPLFFWLTYPDIQFEIFGQYFGIGCLGFFAHLAVACWGIFLLVRHIK